ncbi:DUF397 domain-containing protein [Streptomyces griseoviridis]|uniref:DUF397 domain-containing protein n=2 Tax=Streptomyces TaxID=1883 RepID=A0A3S9ZGR3_STRGD|nr:MULTISPECIES: DUF397 domain-containing protein [Streptomyces]AZS86947.1 DUF397 domain-containing protein [Streptomyces griseoviridis]MDT0475496.1 DUF397 domain-containing protein [Streptomyces sp. DSM 41014]QCN86197.1 DUF397 domain-containing protein [Streptomyces griseoviridis]
MNHAPRTAPDLSEATWRGSTYSGGNNECVEMADGISTAVPVRDSKRPLGPVVAFGPRAWREFLSSLGR